MKGLPYRQILIGMALAGSACESELVVNPELSRASGSAAAYYLEPEWASPGETVIIHGAGLREGMQLTVAGEIVSLEVLGPDQAGFVVPSTLASGPAAISLQKGDAQLSGLNVWVRSQGDSFSDLAPDQVCKGVRYTSSEGEHREGERNCAASESDNPLPCSATLRIGCVTSEGFPALDKNKLRMNPLFHVSLSIQGVIGTIDSCEEGDADCYVDPYSLIAQPLKAIDSAAIVPNVIKQGSTLASIAGTLPPPPADCAADGATECLAVANFPAVDRNYVSTHSSMIRNTLSIGGVTGTLAACADLGSACYVPAFNGGSQPRKAIDFSSIDPLIIKNGTVIGGVTGTVPVADPDCTADAEIGCLTTTPFPAADKNRANSDKAKFDSSLTIAGIQGTLTSCSSDGAVACSTVNAYPALDANNWNSQKNLARSSLSLAAVSGTLGDCVANGSACYLPAYASGTQPLKAISYDSLSAAIIKNGSAIAGINGTLLEAPANCSSDGASGCVAIASYPAVEQAVVDSNKAKIHNSLSLGGITGTLADCNADGNASCLTVVGFPAVDKTLVDSNKAKVHSSLTLGGIAGTMPDCTTDGQTSCLAVANYPAADKSAIDSQKSKVHSSLTFAAVTGTLGSCASNGSDCYLPPYAAATQPLKAIDYDGLSPGIIKAGSAIAGINGTVQEAPAACTADGDTSCVTVANFPAMDKAAIDAGKAKIQTTLTLGGVTGTATTCSSDGDLSCITTAGYPSLDKGNLSSNTSGLRSTVSIAGLSGTLADCAANGSNCYLPSYNAGTQNLKAINYNDLTPNVIKLNHTIADVTGTLVEMPSACTADSDVTCVTSSNFPAVNQANIDANKAKILPSLTVGGVTGTLANCAADAATSCYTVAAYPAFDKVAIDAAKGSIRSSLTIGGISGTLADCNANGSNCFVPTYALSTQPLKAINFDVITSSVVKSGSSIAGVNGSVIQAPDDCSADAETDCVAVANFPALDKTSVDSNKAKMHSSLTAAGITGTMPSCTSDGGTSCLTTATFPAVEIATINSNKAKILSTVSIGNVQGTMSSCAALGSDCYIPAYAASTQPLKAIDFDSFSPAVIKGGTTLAGVSGDYPSSTYPLSTGDAFADFTAAAFNTEIRSATTYGWFDRNGTRHTHAGDADISAANIRSGVSIFAVSGSFTVPNSWDVRLGTAISSSESGKLKLNCRNPANLSTWDASVGRIAAGDATTDVFTAIGHNFSNGQAVRVGYPTTGAMGLATSQPTIYEM